MISENTHHNDVAVCLSGHMRSWELLTENLFKTFGDPSQTDYFIHTWDDRGYRQWENSTGKLNVEKVKNVLRPVSMVVENLGEVDGKYATCIEASMFRKVFLSNELKKQHEEKRGKKYSLVIRMRPDVNIITTSGVSIRNDERFRDGSIWVPFGQDHGSSALNDQIAIGTSEVIDRYCEIGRDFPLERKHPETALGAHVRALKVSLQRPDYIKHDLLRYTGQGKNLSKRIAVCLSGHMRSWRTNYKTIFGAFGDPTEADYFIHTYDTYSWRNGKENLLIETEEIKDIFRPISMIVEKNSDFSDATYKAAYMFRKVFLCNELKKNYEQEMTSTYGLVARLRPDILLDMKAGQENYFRNFETFGGELFIPIGSDSGGLCDQMAVGASPVIDKYSGIGNNISLTSAFHPETHMKNYINGTGLQVRRIGNDILKHYLMDEMK